MKKFIALLLSFMVLSCSALAEELGLSASSAVVIEATEGKVLYEKNPDEKRGMASTTKIMTAIVALEEGNPNDVVKVSSHAANVEGSSMYLKEGEEITLENLVYGLMLVSGNDAATAIAEHIAKSEKEFAKLMNKKAKEIGANNTNFTNPHGLSDENHYTTATDLAKITAYGLKNSVFSEIVSTKSKTIEREGLGKTTLVNHNKLLKTYDGCIGVKTGFTKATGRCLVSASERNNLKIICVTLCAGDDWNDHIKMSNWTFENHKMTLYGREGTVAKTFDVKGGRGKSLGGLFRDDIYLLEKTEGEWELRVSAPDKVSAPVKKGQVIGQIVAEHKSGEKKVFEIVAEKDVLTDMEFKKQRLGENILKIYKSWLCIFAKSL